MEIGEDERAITTVYLFHVLHPHECHEVARCRNTKRAIRLGALGLRPCQELIANGLLGSVPERAVHLPRLYRTFRRILRTLDLDEHARIQRVRHNLIRQRARPVRPLVADISLMEREEHGQTAGEQGSGARAQDLLDELVNHLLVGRIEIMLPSVLLK